MKRVDTVAASRLCLGCGACQYICPNEAISLVNLEQEGIRPYIGETDCGDCTDCLQVCPAAASDISSSESRPGILQELFPYFGPILEIWEGYACDDEIRHKGSSGGALTALSTYCIEKAGMAGVLHIGQSIHDAFANETRFSQSRQEILANAGSRYNPASACDRLDLIENAAAPCVFIGQPSEVTALKKAQAMRPELAKNVGLTLSFFCAGTPSTKGTKDLVRDMGQNLDELSQLRYRGHGWPGMFVTKAKGATDFKEHIPYRDTWRYLQKYRPMSTHLCPDGSGEDADISCGDPWHKSVKQDPKGFSLIVVRTERGRSILREAVAAGYLNVEPSSSQNLIQSQGYLIQKRGAVWGRVLAFKMLGLKTPKLKGYHLWQNWKALRTREKTQSIAGTLKRIIKRKLYKRLEVSRPSNL